MTQAATARAALLREAGKPWTIEDIEVAAPRDDEVRVRMVATGMCHTDIVVRDGFPVPLPIVLGHEGAGVVEAIGAGVSHVAPGDHVVLSFTSCGRCPNCAGHRGEAYCYEFFGRNFSGARIDDGSSPLSQNGDIVQGMFFGQSSFSSLAVASAASVVPVPKDAPLEILGPLGCGIQTGAGAALLSLGVGAGNSLAVFGGGAVGLSALMGAKAVDAGPVVVIEPNAERRKLATELGADAVVDPTEAGIDVKQAVVDAAGGAGLQFALDTTGIPDVVAVACATLLPGGSLGLLGVPPQEANLPINMLDMLIRGLTVKYITEGDATPRDFIPRMVELHAQGKFPFDRLIAKFPFDQINEAAAASENGEAIKPVLVF